MTDDQSPELDQQTDTIAERLLVRDEEHADSRATLIAHWARAETWTLLEGIALAWTLDPKGVTDSTPSPYRWRRPLPEDALHHLELARRCSGADMPEDRVKPAQLPGQSKPASPFIRTGTAPSPPLRHLPGRNGPARPGAVRTRSERR